MYCVLNSFHIILQCIYNTLSGSDRNLPSSLHIILHKTHPTYVYIVADGKYSDDGYCFKYKKKRTIANIIIIYICLGKLFSTLIHTKTNIIQHTAKYCIFMLDDV